VRVGLGLPSHNTHNTANNSMICGFRFEVRDAACVCQKMGWPVVERHKCSPSHSSHVVRLLRGGAQCFLTRDPSMIGKHARKKPRLECFVLFSSNADFSAVAVSRP
jgi:hypothetical protein